MARLFSERRIEKEYVALVEGSPPEERWTVDIKITRLKGRYTCTADGPGKEAVTEFTRLGGGGGLTLVRASPRTGRTHQIRLHLAEYGHPILGDRRYGGRQADRLMLHAESLTFEHPLTGEETRIVAPRPAEWGKSTEL